MSKTNLDNLNKWLTLLANVGVLIGIVFLAQEISQSNRIATFDAEHTVRTTSMDAAEFVAQNRESMAKFRDPEAELTPADIEVATAYVGLRNNSWGNVEMAFQSGLLSERSYEIRALEIDQIFNDYPRLLPFFNANLDIYDFENNPLEIFNRQIELLEEAGLR